MASPVRTDWRPAILSAILALGLYAVSLWGTYVYDDRYIVQGDPRISHPDQWGQFWTKDYFNGGPDNLYRPLVSMSYAVQAYLHGTTDNRAWLFHLVNWLLNAAVCAGVAEFTRRLFDSRTAILAGLLFAAHPIHVEAVANIIGRAELACALGIILSLILILHRPLTIRRAVAIWACVVLSLLSKEQGMLLPLALLFAWFLRPRSTAIQISSEQPDNPATQPVELNYRDPATPSTVDPERSPRLILILLIAWTVAGYIVFREQNLKFWWDRSFLDWTINPIMRSTGSDRILLPIALFGRYSALLLMPVRFTLDYGARVIMPTVSPTDPHLYIGFASILIAAVAFVITLRRRAYSIAFCLFAFALFYSVVSNMLTLIGVHFAERLMYIPSIFFLILIARLLAPLRRPVLIPLVTTIIILLSVRTVTYAWQWNDRLRLYEYTLARQPESLRLHLLLAEELKEHEQYDRAEEILARARQMQPDYFKLWIDSGHNQAAKGDRRQAFKFLLEAKNLRPSVQGTPLFQELAKEFMTQSSATHPSPASTPATLP
jgi:hypothetical protein